MGLKIYFILKFNMFVLKKILLFPQFFFFIVDTCVKILRASPLREVLRSFIGVFQLYYVREQ